MIKMVEAGGVEPPSGNDGRKATPCSAASVYSPRRLKKRQDDGEATPNEF
jgi:hypothetical protein